MKEINCPNCNKKLGIIDEKEMSVTYEDGVTPFRPSCSSGLIVFHFECPDCGKTHMQTIVP